MGNASAIAIALTVALLTQPIFWACVTALLCASVVARGFRDAARTLAVTLIHVNRHIAGNRSSRQNDDDDDSDDDGIGDLSMGELMGEELASREFSKNIEQPQSRPFRLRVSHFLSSLRTPS